MKINLTKTQVMVISKNDSKINIDIDSKKLEQVDEFKYLGVTIDKKGGCETEIDKRIEGTAKLYHALNNVFINKKEVTKKTKLTIYKTIYQPTLLFGCEAWVLTQKQKSKIQAMEMKYLRRTKGITRRDRIRNTEIRAELGVAPVQEKIEEKQLQWLGHLIRMDNDRQVKQVWEARSSSKRARGRPRESWNNAVGKILKRKGQTWQSAKILALDRRRWARFVHSNS